MWFKFGRFETVLPGGRYIEFRHENLETRKGQLVVSSSIMQYYEGFVFNHLGVPCTSKPLSNLKIIQTGALLARMPNAF